MWLTMGTWNESAVLSCWSLATLAGLLSGWLVSVEWVAIVCTLHVKL